MTVRPEMYQFKNGEKVKLPFTNQEYESRLTGLRSIIDQQGLDFVVCTSMQSIGYYSGFLYCSFGRPYGLVVSKENSVLISAALDSGQPGRRCYGENLIYTDWQRDNYWRAVKSVTGEGKKVGFEGDHLTIIQKEKFESFLNPARSVDIADMVTRQRMNKSIEELKLIREGARIADVGGYAIHDALKEGLREIDVAMVGRNALEVEIAKSFPDAEYRDTWVWLQSGINTDGAHNPVTGRVIQRGDPISLNAFPMISGYYTALERTLFLGETTPANLKYWQANIETHEFGISLLKPGIKCSEVAHKINAFLEERDLLQYRTFGYGHSFGILSHYYGREAGLELREDIDTVLEPGMVVSMEPMITIAEGQDGAGGYREHDILIINEDGNENITKYPYGPEFNVVG